MTSRHSWARSAGATRSKASQAARASAWAGTGPHLEPTASHRCLRIMDKRSCFCYRTALSLFVNHLQSTLRVRCLCCVPGISDSATIPRVPATSSSPMTEARRKAKPPGAVCRGCEPRPATVAVRVGTCASRQCLAGGSGDPHSERSGAAGGTRAQLPVADPSNSAAAAGVRLARGRSGTLCCQ